jgi:hypothetical protein
VAITEYIQWVILGDPACKIWIAVCISDDDGQTGGRLVAFRGVMPGVERELFLIQWIARIETDQAPHVAAWPVPCLSVASSVSFVRLFDRSVSYRGLLRVRSVYACTLCKPVLHSISQLT